MAATAVVTVESPDDLTEHEQRLAGEYAEMPPHMFDLVVARLVTGGATDELQHVLFSGGLAQDTLKALGRLQAAAQQQAGQAPRGSARRGELTAHVQAIGALRKELRPVVNLAVADAARKGPRHHARRIMGQVRYAELKEIMADLAGGMTEREAADAYRARLASLGETGLAVMPGRRQ